MKMIVGLLSASAILVAGSSFAAQEQSTDKTVAQCTQQAQKAGVPEQNMDLFIMNCIEDKVGYERTKPGESGGGGE